MTDTGNTATQVSPSSESDDMSKVREVFDRALNAIVQSTALAQQVQELASRVDALSRDVDQQRQRNAWLDEQLTSVRQTRDKALSDLSQAKTELDNAKGQIEGLTVAKDSAEQVIASLNAELAHVRKDRDDAQMRVMELEDSLASANATIGKAKEQFKSLFSLVEPEKPKPIEVVQPTYVPPAQPSPEPYNSTEAQSQAEPSPEPAPYRGW